MKKEASILITGGAGFVGSHLVELLINQGFNNVYLTYHHFLPEQIKLLIKPEHCFSLDLTDKLAVAKLLKIVKPDYLFHLASTAITFASFDDPFAVFANNLKLDSNLLSSLKKFSPKSRCLWVGSGMEYQLNNQNTLKKIDENFPLGPSSPYGVAKVASDLLALSYHQSFFLPIVRVRPFNHCGERQSLGFVIPDFMEQILKIKQQQLANIQVGNLNIIRDFTDVKDVVRAYLLLMQKGKEGEVYNLGVGVGVSIKKILDLLMKVFQIDCRIVIDSKKIRKNEVKQIIVDNCKLVQLGWKPEIKIEETIQRICESI